MTRTPRKKLLKHLQRTSEGGADGWRTQELQAEIMQTHVDLTAARVLERAAKRRHDKENKSETETAYVGRRDEASRIYQRLNRLLSELNQRSGCPLARLASSSPMKQPAITPSPKTG